MNNGTENETEDGERAVPYRQSPSCSRDGKCVNCGKEPQPPPDCRSVSRMPTGFGVLFDSGARRRSPMDDMVTRANCVEQHAPFSKNGVGKLLKPLHPPSRRNCKSILTCVSVSARLTVCGRHSESATIPSAPSREKKGGRCFPSTRVARRRS